MTENGINGLNDLIIKDGRNGGKCENGGRVVIGHDAMTNGPW